MAGVNPYQFARKCIFGKWKMTILHHIHNYGVIRFNETRNTLPITDKVLAEQLRELADDGLVERFQYNTIPVKVEYRLTELGQALIPALDSIYIWSIRRMYEMEIPIDPDAWIVHAGPEYTGPLADVMQALGVLPPTAGETDSDNNRYL